MNRFPVIFGMPPREGDGGGGGNSPPAPGGEGAPPSPPSGSPPSPSATGQPGDGNAPPGGADQWTMPDGWPDHLKADTRDEFYGKLEGWTRQLRDQVARAPQPAKAVDDYKFEPSEKAKPFVGDLASDPTYKAAQKAALAAGMPADAFAKFVGAFYDDMAEAGLLVKPLDVRSEALKFLGNENSPLDEKAALAQLAPIAEPILRAIDKIADDAKLSPEAKAVAYSVMDTAEGMRFMQAVVGALGKQGITPGGDAGGSGAVTREQLQQMQQDPRADRNSVTYDPAFVEKINDGYKRIAG